MVNDVLWLLGDESGDDFGFGLAQRLQCVTNYTTLLHLSDGYTPELVRDAFAAKIQSLPEVPEVLRASLTRDQGAELCHWKQVAVDADIDIFFCDPPTQPCSGPPTDPYWCADRQNPPMPQRTLPI